jgi:hypothetical protein
VSRVKDTLLVPVILEDLVQTDGEYVRDFERDFNVAGKFDVGFDKICLILKDYSSRENCMGNFLIFLHATVAELGLFAFLWVLVELLNPTGIRIKRAQIAAIIGVVCLLTAWIAGGFYYVEVYGPQIKPVIKGSDAKWVHSIVMEVKEHVFLFLPILATLTMALILKHGEDLINKRDARITVVLLSGLIFLLGFSIAGMGAIIASGYRFALEAGLI